MHEEHTTAAVHRYLQDLAGDAPMEPVVRALLGRSAGRLEQLCRTLLVRQYPRLMRPPVNLAVDEMLSAVVERLIKAMRQVRPETPRQFFALATKHMRWELNDLARRLDSRAREVELDASIAAGAAFAASAESSGDALTPGAVRMLDAIDGLPDDAREVFDLVRIQGLSHTEVAEVLGVSTKTVQRRLQQSLLLLADALGDLSPHPELR